MIVSNYLKVITTDGHEGIIELYNEDAIAAHKAIEDAGKREADWTTPVKLSDGSKVTFVLRNIVAFTFI